MIAPAATTLFIASKIEQVLQNGLEHCVPAAV
jgi:hypothetical protein